MLAVNPLNLFNVIFVEDELLDERANRLTASTHIKLRNVYTYFRGLFQARLYIGDEQFCLASGTPQKCIRFADCALYHFWPYRRKPDRHIMDSDLNLGIEWARREINTTVAVRDHLVSIETELIKLHKIHPDSKRPPRERVCRVELARAWGEYKACLDSVKLTAVEKSLGAYESAIAAHVDEGTKLNASIDRQIFGA